MATQQHTVSFSSLSSSFPQFHETMFPLIDAFRRRLLGDSFCEARSLTSTFFLAWLLKQGVVDQRQIASKSMHPTLAVGDRVLVDKASVVFGQLLGHQRRQHLRRNDIVVFKPPEHSRHLFAELSGEDTFPTSARERMLPWRPDVFWEEMSTSIRERRLPWKQKRSWHGRHSPLNSSMDFTKRVVGIAGDEVAVQRGLLYVNKNVARAFPEVASLAPSNGNVATKGVSMTRQENGSKASYSWGPIVIPKDHVVVLGDCRDESFDSHMWGPLPVHNVVGRACARYWPLHRLAWFRRDDAS